jgi:large subunit ribosomal protein L17
MHRHGYKGRKFGRERDQREALIKGLAESLIIHESIETTLPKAKEVVPYIEKLITKAKKGDLHNRRQIISSLHTISTAHKLVDELAPKLKGRDSGHLRIKRTSLRRGDNAQLARVSFVDELAEAPVAKAAVKAAEAPTEAKPTVKKTSAAAKAKADKPAKKEAK